MAGVILLECSVEKRFVDYGCFFERWCAYGVTIGHAGVILFDAGSAPPTILAAAARIDSAGACGDY